MKKIICILLIVLISVTSIFAAKVNDFNAKNLSLGVVLGSSNGATFKYDLNREMDLSLDVGFAFIGSGGAHGINIDIFSTYEFYEIDAGKITIPLSTGLGFSNAIVLGGGGYAIGLLVPIQASFSFKEVPFDMFIRFAPGFHYVFGGSVGFDFRANLGLLWNFK